MLISGIQGLPLEVTGRVRFSVTIVRLLSALIQLHKVLSQGYDDTAWPIQDKCGRYSGEVRLILYYSATNQSKTKATPSAPPCGIQSPTMPGILPYPQTTASPYSTPSPYTAVPAYPPASTTYLPSAYPPPPTYSAYPPSSSMYPPPPAYLPPPAGYPTFAPAGYPPQYPPCAPAGYPPQYPPPAATCYPPGPAAVIYPPPPY
ncbi:hypothetical protein NL676_025888 [Syzygium grande]|nr:hypothetical protein NL676_025888 [Syzygium grande]